MFVFMFLWLRLILFFFFFFFNDTATTEIYTLSLHDALPIYILLVEDNAADVRLTEEVLAESKVHNNLMIANDGEERSEEHTSELQSPCNLVCRLLLEKKKTK